MLKYSIKIVEKRDRLLTGSSEGQSPFDGGFGDVPQSQNSPKSGGHRGLRKD